MIGLNPLDPKLKDVTPQKPFGVCAKQRFLKDTYGSTKTIM